MTWSSQVKLLSRIARTRAFSIHSARQSTGTTQGTFAASHIRLRRRWLASQPLSSASTTRLCETPPAALRVPRTRKWARRWHARTTSRKGRVDTLSTRLERRGSRPARNGAPRGAWGAPPCTTIAATRATPRALTNAASLATPQMTTGSASARAMPRHLDLCALPLRVAARAAPDQL